MEKNKDTVCTHFEWLRVKVRGQLIYTDHYHQEAINLKGLFTASSYCIFYIPEGVIVNISGKTIYNTALLKYSIKILTISMI